MRAFRDFQAVLSILVKIASARTILKSIHLTLHGVVIIVIGHHKNLKINLLIIIIKLVCNQVGIPMGGAVMINPDQICLLFHRLIDQILL